MCHYVLVKYFDPYLRKSAVTILRSDAKKKSQVRQEIFEKGYEILSLHINYQLAVKAGRKYQNFVS